MDIATLRVFDKLLPDNQARLLTGPAGIGKSATVRKLAEDRGYAFIDLRLSELEPADLVGLPFLEPDPTDPTGKEKITKYARPWYWPTDGKVILFLDEVDRCREDMQPLAMQLTLDRRAGGRNLPDGVIVYAAANGEKYMTSAIDQALINRFALIEFTPKPEEWMEWARDEKNQVHDTVIQFIQANPGMLDMSEKQIGEPNVAVNTRRSWTALGMFLNNMQKEADARMGGTAKADISKDPNMHLYAQTFVGLTPALNFSSWAREKYQVLSPRDPFTGKVKPDNLGIVQVSSIIDEVVKIFMDEKCTEKERLNCLKFFKEAGHEVFGAFFSAMPKDGAKLIKAFPEIDKFVKEVVQHMHAAQQKKNEKTAKK